MRVALFSAHFPPDMSGMGDYTYFLANALARIDCEVNVVTSVGETDGLLYPLIGSVSVHRVIKTWGMSQLAQILRIVRELKTDVVVVQYTPHAFQRRGITLAVNLLPLLFRSTSRVRVVINFHELFIPFDRSLRRSLGALWQRAMALLIAAPSHALTAISSEWPKRLRRVGVWKSIQVIPVGSNIPRTNVSQEDLKSVRVRLGLDESTLLVGCFGSAGHDRDTALLLKVSEEVKRQSPFKLLWLGKPGIETTSLDSGSDDIIWTGPLPHPEVSRMMAACDLLVLPYRDGVSTKRGTLAAALLHELPVLTTRGNHLDDLFVNCENLYLVPAGDGRAFAEGLLELVKRPDLRARLAAGGKALHDSHFSWGVIARQVVRVAKGESNQ